MNLGSDFILWLRSLMCRAGFHRWRLDVGGDPEFFCVACLRSKGEAR